MNQVTMLKIVLQLDENQSLSEAIADLPRHCADTFQEHAKGWWNGEIVVSCPVAPQLADGDFVDDLAPYFPELLKLKTFYHAEFEFQVAVGAPAPEEFELESHLVAMLAALGTRMVVVCNGTKT